MARKCHKKSKQGCQECKRRHIKCDESRPICQKCIASERVCRYDAAERGFRLSRAPLKDLSSSTNNTPGSVPHQGTPQHQVDITTVSQDQIISPTDINLTHLELLYNYEHETCKTVARNDEHIDIFRHATIRRAFKQPFLMHAILALSALHFSLKRAPEAAEYSNITATLQSKALQEFHLIFPNAIDETNVLDVLLFQYIVGIHVFCDVFTNTVNDSFSVFLERLIGSIRLLRGINSVIQQWWDTLSQTEIGVIMQTSHIHQEETPHQSHDECSSLRVLIAEADLSSKSILVCQQSLARLQSYFDAENTLGDAPIESTNMLFAWLVTTSSEYIEMLDQRRPEALVILAYYSVLLHRRRRSWAVGDSGGHLLRQINGYLGNSWKDWLAWPNSVVAIGTA